MKHIEKNMFNPAPFNNYIPEPTKEKNVQILLSLLLFGVICFVGWYLIESENEEQ